MVGDVTATIVTVTTTTDKYGDTTSTTTSVDVGGCQFAPGQSQEPTLALEPGVVTDGVLYAPAGTAVDAADRVVVAGLAYSVIGDPQQWPDGVVVALRRWRQP